MLTFVTYHFVEFWGLFREWDHVVLTQLYRFHCQKRGSISLCWRWYTVIPTLPLWLHCTGSSPPQWNLAGWTLLLLSLLRVCKWRTSLPSSSCFFCIYLLTISPPKLPWLDSKFENKAFTWMLVLSD